MPDQLTEAFGGSGMTNLRLVSNQWLIHFTDRASAMLIAKEGFILGSSPDANLALTLDTICTGPGINFAYETSDEMSLLTMSERRSRTDDGAAVIFQGDGLAMSHYDDFDQVAFWGRDAMPPFIVIEAVHDDVDLDSYDGFEEPHERLWRLATPIGDEAREDLLLPLLEWIERRAS